MSVQHRRHSIGVHGVRTPQFLGRGGEGRKGRGWREVKENGKGREGRGILPDFYHCCSELLSQTSRNCSVVGVSMSLCFTNVLVSLAFTSTVRRSWRVTARCLRTRMSTQSMRLQSTTGCGWTHRGPVSLTALTP